MNFRRDNKSFAIFFRVTLPIGLFYHDLEKLSFLDETTTANERNHMEMVAFTISELLLSKTTQIWRNYLNTLCVGKKVGVEAAVLLACWAASVYSNNIATIPNN